MLNADNDLSSKREQYIAAIAMASTAGAIFARLNAQPSTVPYDGMNN